MPSMPIELTLGPNARHAIPSDVSVLFQCKLNKFCIVSCVNNLI